MARGQFKGWWSVEMIYAEASGNPSIGDVEPTRAAREWAQKRIGDYRLKKPLFRR